MAHAGAMFPELHRIYAKAPWLKRRAVGKLRLSHGFSSGELWSGHIRVTSMGTSRLLFAIGEPIKKDGRRKHHHWQVTVFYNDGETFIRKYSDHDKTAGFAERQKKSPVVKMARVIEIS